MIIKSRTTLIPEPFHSALRAANTFAKIEHITEKVRECHPSLFYSDAEIKAINETPYATPQIRRKGH